MAEIFASESSSATELQVINSRSVIGKVVDELNLFLNIEKDNFSFIKKLPEKNFLQDIDIQFFEIPSNLIDESFSLVIEDDQRYSLWHDGDKLLNSSVEKLENLMMD